MTEIKEKCKCENCPGTFEDRPRYTYEEMIKEMQKPEAWVKHALLNDDGTYSVMRHINCEWCDYCDAANAAYDSGLRSTEARPFIHMVKEDPYEHQNLENNAHGFMGDFFRIRENYKYAFPLWFEKMLNSWFKEFSEKVGYTEPFGQKDLSGKKND